MAFNAYTLGSLPQNKHNFIRWYKVGDSTYNTFPRSNKHVESCLEEYPVIAADSFVGGLRFNYYANIDTLDATEDTSDWGIAVIDENDNILNALGGAFATKDVITGSSFRFYSTLVNPSFNIAGTRLAIYNKVSNALYYRSNRIKVVSASDAVNKYVQCKYRHSRTNFNINYTALTSYYNYIRLPIEYVKDDVATTQEVYKEGSTGNYRNSAFEAERIYTFRVRKLSADNHEAFISMLRHDEVYFNGRRFTYRPQSPYNSNLQNDININNGIFQMAEYDYAIANKYIY